MALLQWSYIAQQIAGHLVARRDKLDDALRALGRIDLRIAWIGWILSLILWSIRSLVDTVFGLVIRLQRALEREMEFQADLVAVSLTGSNALINALHRLRAGDESWDRTLAFTNVLLAREHIPGDVFALHARFLERIGGMLGDPAFGRVPPVPVRHPETHRVFTTEFAMPPAMWLTHPLNHDREANAKRRYVAAEIDARSAWELFDDPAAVRTRLTAMMLDVKGRTVAAPEESLAAQDEELGRERFNARYRGIYIGRSIVRGAEHVEELIGPPPPLWRRSLDSLYPESLGEEMLQRRRLERELAQLRAISTGVLTATDRAIRHRGRALRKRDLPEVIGLVDRELWAVDERLRAADRTCRSAHLAAAEELGGGWPEYLRGTLAVLHYADHTLANLQDAATTLSHTVHFSTVTRRISDEGGRARVLAAAEDLSLILSGVHTFASSVGLDPRLLARMRIASWTEALGKFELPPPTAQILGQWLAVVDGWVRPPVVALERLRDAALDELLRAEEYVAQCVRQGSVADPAPAPSHAPPSVSWSS